MFNNELTSICTYSLSESDSGQACFLVSNSAATVVGAGVQVEGIAFVSMA
jgi:hypothetical protein